MRYIGKFLADPLDGMPAEVIDFPAGQLQIADPSCPKRCSVREPTHREHAGTIQKALAVKDFAEVEASLSWPEITGSTPRRCLILQ